MGVNLKLFCQLRRGEWFHFHDNPSRLLVKFDGETYVGVSGQKRIHPHVAIIHEPPKVHKITHVIEDEWKGDKND